MDELDRANKIAMLHSLNAIDQEVRITLALFWHVVFSDEEFREEIAAVFETKDVEWLYKTRAVCAQAPEFSPPALSYLF